MRFTSPLPTQFQPVAYFKFSFEELRHHTGIDFSFRGPQANLWHTAYCRIETISMVFAQRVLPAPSEMFLFLRDADTLLQAVARTVLKSAFDQAGAKLNSLIWYDADFLGEVTGAPGGVHVKKTKPPDTSSNPVFADSLTDFMFDSPLLPDKPPRGS